MLLCITLFLVLARKLKRCPASCPVWENERALRIICCFACSFLWQFIHYYTVPACASELTTPRLQLGFRSLEHVAFVSSPALCEHLIERLLCCMCPQFDDTVPVSWVQVSEGAGDGILGWKNIQGQLLMGRGGKGDKPLPAFTLAEVAKHNTPTDAWLVISGKVCVLLA